MKRLLSTVALVGIALTSGAWATDCNGNAPAPQPPPGPPVTTATQFNVITGERHDIGLGVYEYRLLLDDPNGDRWVNVSKQEYNSCMKQDGLRYPACALGGK
jgi:hypothetical protein